MLSVFHVVVPQPLCTPACAYYGVAVLEGFSPESWVVRDNVLDEPPIIQYSFALLATVSMMVTAGYGTFSSGPGGPTVSRVIARILAPFRHGTHLVVSFL